MKMKMEMENEKTVSKLLFKDCTVCDINARLRGNLCL